LVFVAVHAQEQKMEIIALDPASGEQKFSFARHRGYLRELAVSPDGDWVAGSSMRGVRLWDLRGGKRPSRAPGRVEDCARYAIGNVGVARAGAYLAIGGNNSVHPVEIFDGRTGERQALSGRNATAGCVAFAPDRPLLAFTQQRKEVGEVVFWDARARA